MVGLGSLLEISLVDLFQKAKGHKKGLLQTALLLAKTVRNAQNITQFKICLANPSIIVAKPRFTKISKQLFDS